MSVIDVKDLTFSYDGSLETLFDHVSLQLDTRWKLGLIGRNGRGKTTFLRLLMGEHAYGGQIRTAAAFEYFPYGVPDGTRSAGEVLRAIAPAAEDWELERELSLLEVSEETLAQPFDTLSFGEQTKALLAALFLKENAFLLIDEPTNHLDALGRRKLAAYLARKRGFILVSHDRAFLDGCVDHILSINRADIELQKGNFSSWQENRLRQDRYELAEQEKLKKDAARLEQAARRTSVWSDRTEQRKYGSRNSGLRPDRGYLGHKSAKLMQRAKTVERRREAALEETKGLLKNLEREEPLDLWPEPYPGRRLLEVRDLTVRWGGRQVCGPVSFTVEPGDRVRLAGRNGCGKTSVLRILLGELAPEEGSVQRGSGLKISYVSQSTAGLTGTPADYARQYGLTEHRFKAILRKLNFSREQLEQDMASYSGGQKKKALLARSLCEEAHLYLWDEPLNFVDLFSRMQIEALLEEVKPTMVFVEHDAAFAERVATKVVAL